MSASLSSESPEATAAAGCLTSTAAIADPPDLTTGAVGTPRPRIEGRAKVTGTARYAADVPMPDLAFGCVVTSTVSRGRIRDIDASAVLHMPGVLGVIDHTNAPRLNGEAGNVFGPHGGLHLLQDDEIPHAGRPIALVVAENLEQATAMPPRTPAPGTASTSTTAALPATTARAASARARAVTAARPTKSTQGEQR
jgi:xanthine dehydrogenase YagR molybdenum-binding subunit